MKTEKQLEKLLRTIDEREKKTRRRAFIYTIIPIIAAGLLIWFTGSNVISAQNKLKTAQTQLSETVASLSKIVSITHKIENRIERKESVLRSLGEARLLIDIRMLADEIDAEFSDLSIKAPEMPELSRDRIWITIIESSQDLEKLKSHSQRWVDLYGKDQVVIYCAPNNFYALALKGDESFTKAYRLTVELIENGLAYDAYFAYSEDWGENFLE